MQKNGGLAHILSMFEYYYNLYPVIGLEIEFYLLPKKNHSTWDISIENNKILQEINGVIFKKFPDFVAQFKRERAKGQYEICSKPRSNLVELVSDYYQILEELRKFALDKDLKLDFSPKPFTNNYGSSVQINISFQNLEGENIFLPADHKDKHSLLNLAVNGLCESLKEKCLIYANSSQSYERMIPGFKAPTHIAYGFDNRTTALRIANSLDNKKYLEFRVPDISMDLEMGLYSLLETIFSSWRKPIEVEYKPIYGVASHSQYNLRPLASSLTTALNEYKNSLKPAPA